MRIAVILAAVAVSAMAHAQELAFVDAAGDDAALQREMTALARRVLPQYRDADRLTYLDNLFRLQLEAGRYAEAAESIATLRRLRAPQIPDGGAWIDVQYEMLARARLEAETRHADFAASYRRVFRDTLARLDDVTAGLVIRTITGPDPGQFSAALRAARERRRGKQTISVAEAVELVRDHQVDAAYRMFLPLAAPLVEEDDRRRYVIVPRTPIALADGANICAVIVRPRTAERLPALLTFTIYADRRWEPLLGRLTASHGYASIVGYTRGKACAPGPVSPYRHDGEDAAALVDWIAAQPWSDGRVGMYGGSYSGFTAFAAAKHMPKALRAIAVGAAAAPAIDVPMEGNVFWSFIYPWPFYTTDGPENDDATYNDSARWNRLTRSWYESGRAYRDLDQIDGKPNPVFDEWLMHPSYDAYWQAEIPYAKDFARIDIPILQTAGYFDGGPGAAVHYLTEHYKQLPGANHYLVIGPYDHFGAQIGVVSLLGQLRSTLDGLPLDPVARIDIEQLRHQFFDWIFKHAPRPPLLADKINHQVIGANVWKHAPSLAAMSDQRLRLHFAEHRLTAEVPPRGSFIAHTVNLADRSDVDRKVPGGGVLDHAIDTWNGFALVGDPLPAATELSGLFSAHLELTVNKKDFDFEIDLYEQTPRGEYVQLAQSWWRASYIGHAEQRRLLTPNQRTRLDVASTHLMSRRLQAGSRVVLVLTVIKEPGRQIDYGTGKDVSAETIADAGAPLAIKWFGESWVELPVAR